MRVYNLAKELGWTSRSLLHYLDTIGEPLPHASSNVPHEVVEYMRSAPRDRRRLMMPPSDFQPKPPWPEIVTTAQAARIAHVKNATIRQWVHRGYLVPVSVEQPSRSSSFNSANVVAAVEATKERRRRQEPDYAAPNLTRRGFDAVVSVSQAATYLRVPEPTIRSWVRRRKITPVGQRGRTSLFRLRDIYAVSPRQITVDGRAHPKHWGEPQS